MKTKLRAAMAGTLESSDVLVTVSPADRLTVSYSSTVANQYGKRIKDVVEQALRDLDVTEAAVTVEDRGALDCTLRARVVCAVYRARGCADKDIPWGGDRV